MAALPPQAAATVPTVRWWPGCWACCQTMNASRTAFPWRSRPGWSGRKLEVMGASIGGGRINICQIDGITTNFGGDHNTLIVHNQDTPGHVAEVTTALAQRGINIATMQLYRSTAGGYAVMVLECDQPLPDALIAELRGLQGIVKVTGLNLAQQTETKEGA